MARAPSLFLRREDYSEVSEQWMDRLLRPLNTFGKQVQDALSRGLTFGENSRAFTKALTITYPLVAPPDPKATRIHNDLAALGSKPIGVFLLSVLDVPATGPTSPVSAPNPAWSLSGDQVIIWDIAGLIAGHKYQITLLVIGG